MPRHRTQRVIQGHEKHSGTKVHVIGPATVATAFMIVRDTEVGDRDPAGGNDTITLGRSFEEECNIGDVCKYVNIHLQGGPTTVSAGNIGNNGWIEWAFTCAKGSDPPPVNTNLGVSTLGDVCTKYFRNECIYTGNFPVGGAQPASQEITLKIPKTKWMLRVGDEWTLWLHARTVSSTETGTDTFKVYSSYNYINKH